MAELSVTELSKDLRDAIAQLDVSGDLETVGIVTRVGDGVAWVHGLRSAGYSEVLQIETKNGVVEAFALNLNEDEIGAVLLGGDEDVVAGAKVKLKGTILDVPVGPELLGRVVDPLGNPRTEWGREHSADNQPGDRLEQQFAVLGGSGERQGGEEGRGDRDRQEEFGGVDGPDGLARIAALDQQIGRHDGAPTTAARGVEEAAHGAKRLDDPRPSLGVPVHDAAIEEIQAKRRQVCENERLGGCRVNLGQDICADNSSQYPGNGDSEEETPVDVAMGNVADARHPGREGFGSVDPGR